MNPTPISPAEAKAMLDRGDHVTFVDARNAMAWGSSKIKLPHALRIPIDEVDEHLSEIPPDGITITYCT
jgi:hypothetical protein